MKKVFFLFIFFASFVHYSCGQDYAHYVNPFIGTGGHGHTFPGAIVPFGMVQLSPDTRVDGSWDGCSGYHYDDTLIYGFSHTHLSGTGCTDYGDVMLMPTYCKKETYDNKQYRSAFSHVNEHAAPGFYSVLLKDHGVEVKLTTTTRVGFHQYVFTRTGTANIVLDLSHRDELLAGEIKVTGNNKVEGFRRSKAWATDQVIFYSIEFSKPFKEHTLKKDDAKDIAANFLFDVKQGEEIQVKVAISPVGTDGAQKNMQAEIPHWDFRKTKQEATDRWNSELGKVEVSGASQEQLTYFYTALYHTMTAPNIAMDVDHRYRGRDNKIHTAEGFTYYTVFSLWDTFRALHPLLTIIGQQRTKDFVQTFLTQYEQGGRLPVWELACNETDCMIGYHSVSVMTDAAAKGLLTQEQIALAFEAAKKSATWNHLGLPAFMGQGYLSVDDEHESVSKTLEYAYDDWCITRLGIMAGVPADSLQSYYHWAQAYRNLFDPTTRFFRPRKNGGWIAPFEPREVNNHFTEANAWQYSFFVPQDIPGLIRLMGGEQKFAEKLDSLFSVTSKTTGREQADITGLIGQYAHGNEPSHAFAYLFNYAGQPWKSQKYLRTIMDSLYHNAPDGLPGNEDCGQMSAWYVLSAMGFYSITPGLPYYTWGTPLFPEVKIHLENGKTVQITAKGTSSANRYIQKVTVNGTQTNSPVIAHNELMSGARIDFTMGPAHGQPWNVAWNRSELIASGDDFVPVPAIISSRISFKEKQMIAIQPLEPGEDIYYAIGDGKTIPATFNKYAGPFEIAETCTIYAYATDNKGNSSKKVSASFYHVSHNWTIEILYPYNAQYTAGGDEGIIDGIFADHNWRKGGWQGYQGKDFEAVIDMKKATTIRKLSSDYLQDTRAWILMPVKVEYYLSDNGKDFRLAATVQNDVKDSDYTVQQKEFTATFAPQKARYVKVKAYNYGILPAWHQGADGKAFIFVDEVTIE